MLLCSNELAQKHVNEEMITLIEEKKNYIDNLYVETGNIVDFIEELYTA